MRDLLKTFFLLVISNLLASAEFKFEQIGEAQKDPWSLAFINQDQFLLSDLSGELSVISLTSGEKLYTVEGVPEVAYGSQGGLSDVKIDPNFSDNGLIYLSYSAKDPEQDNAVTLFVGKGKLVADELKDFSVIFKAKAPRRVPIHLGAKMAFLPDSTILIASGDAYDKREKAQTLDNHYGKIVRLNLDGSIPEDNPFVGIDGALPEIYSYGHRNMQGLLVLSDGAIIEHEHGPRGGDELNIVEPGKNYGWPAICYCIDYSGAQITPFTEKEGMEQPLKYWRPSIAPSGFLFYESDYFAEWDGHYFISALASKDVRKLSISNGQVEEEILFSDLNARIRNIYQTPKGSLILLVDGPDGRIIEVTK